MKPAGYDMMVFADVAWPFRRSDLLVCFGVTFCIGSLIKIVSTAYTMMMNSPQPQFMSVGRTWVRLLYHALVDATAPKVGTLVLFSCIKELLYNNTRCLKGHLSFGQYIDCSRKDLLRLIYAK